MSVSTNINNFFKVLTCLDEPTTSRKAVHFMRNENGLINCYIIRRYSIFDVNTIKDLQDCLLKEEFAKCILLKNITDIELEQMLAVCVKKFSMLRPGISQIDRVIIIPEREVNDLRIVCGKDVLTEEKYYDIEEMANDIIMVIHCSEKYNIEIDHYKRLIMYGNYEKSYDEIYNELGLSSEDELPTTEIRFIGPDEILAKSNEPVLIKR